MKYPYGAYMVPGTITEPRDPTLKPFEIQFKGSQKSVLPEDRDLSGFTPGPFPELVLGTPPE